MAFVILTFVRFYVPGFKAGGPVRTIANMVDALGEEFEFRIVTSDRDMLDSSAYRNIRPDVWSSIGNSWVYYASEGQRTTRRLSMLMRELRYDVLYLNSLFDPTFTLKPLLIRRLLDQRNAAIVLAPRGELSPAALRFKSWKKTPFLLMAKLFGLYQDVLWHASTESEASLIREHFGVKPRIVIARNLPSRTFDVPTNTNVKDADRPLRIVFLSRISRIKNLDYALRVLSRCAIPVQFDIWGTIEDPGYWRTCQTITDKMPTNVRVSYKGVASAEEVTDILSTYDLFFLPTRGENYGHVIVEALSAGTPVLISDQTPWRHLPEHAVGWDLPLEEDGTEFLHAIEAAHRKDGCERSMWRRRVREFAMAQLKDDSAVAANREVFATAIRLGTK